MFVCCCSCDVDCLLYVLTTLMDANTAAPTASSLFTPEVSSKHRSMLQPSNTQRTLQAQQQQQPQSALLQQHSVNSNAYPMTPQLSSNNGYQPSFPFTPVASELQSANDYTADGMQLNATAPLQARGYAQHTTMTNTNSTNLAGSSTASRVSTSASTGSFSSTYASTRTSSALMTPNIANRSSTAFTTPVHSSVGSALPFTPTANNTMQPVTNNFVNPTAAAPNTFNRPVAASAQQSLQNPLIASAMKSASKVAGAMMRERALDGTISNPVFTTTVIPEQQETDR